MFAKKWAAFAAAAAVGLGFSAHAGAATIFGIYFDDSGGGPDGTIGSPIVGAGVFISPIDLTPGVYSLDSLPGYGFAADIDGAFFSDADLLTPSSGVSVGITQFGAVERLVFTETPGDPGADGGPFGGAAVLGIFMGFCPSNRLLLVATQNTATPMASTVRSATTWL